MPSSSLEIQPGDIQFDLSSKEPTTVLKIRNVSDVQLAFKVKTTMPKRYLVRPNQDVVDGGQTMDVRISLQTKEARKIKLEVNENGEYSEKPDKFLIQSVQLKPEYKAIVEEARSEENGKPMSDVLAKMWQETSKSQLTSTKLQCTFVFPKKADGVNGTNGEEYDTGGDSEDVKHLRKKYNELVNFTVQLTSERDRLRTSYKEATKELQSLRQHVKASGGDEKIARGGGTVSTTGGFPLW
eukprot:CAMPEP_0184009942 /NCGR_PEP_ID=MMETSP0954-20121128/2910_1 /TAXON_ID=627963 /ORGANISM="Aplanochytrium sp, Strain PBS07" /LENGTH=239 /DNA_ID=CAMNT_0026289421 /DNA_START=492 /DNA_END=1208 /DNA_ORIENTATION=+